MRIYWDTSALISYYRDGQIEQIKGATRTDTLAELFAALTGRGIDLRMPDGSLKHKWLTTRLAASIDVRIHARLEFVDLTNMEVLAAVQEAQKRNVQGGRIHDFLHARAAAKAKADELWTLDRNDFDGLGQVAIKQI